MVPMVAHPCLDAEQLRPGALWIPVKKVSCSHVLPAPIRDIEQAAMRAHCCEEASISKVVTHEPSKSLWSDWSGFIEVELGCHRL